jgi:glycosyltransferase involved in cell wall biosynthesis
MTKLRIAWCGPWTANSAIGAVFGEPIVARLLALGHQVEVFRTEAADQMERRPPLPLDVPLHALAKGDAALLHKHPGEGGFDIVIANLGNNYEFHGALYDPPDEEGRGALAATAPLTILHDGGLLHLAAAWAMRDPQRAPEAPWAEAAAELTRDLYGPSSLPEGAPFWTSLESMVHDRPLLEWPAAQSGGILLHSSGFLSRARTACPGPVAVLPLPQPDFRAIPPRPIGQTLHVATLGHVNQNKRAEEVLWALAASPILRARCRYSLLGPIDDNERARLTALAVQLGVDVPHFSGWLPEEAMREALGTVDVITCLRHPVLETGSATLVQAMMTARPVLVSHQGPYAELPPGLVLPCTPGTEAAGVLVHLEAILRDPTAARAMGERARAHALTAHSFEAYVDGLLPVMHAVMEARPLVLAAREMGRDLARWGAGPREPAAVQAGVAWDELFGDRES